MDFREWEQTDDYERLHAIIEQESIRDGLLQVYEAGQRNPIAAPALPADVARVVKAVQRASISKAFSTEEQDALISVWIRLRDLTPASLAAVEAALKEAKA